MTVRDVAKRGASGAKREAQKIIAASKKQAAAIRQRALVEAAKIRERAQHDAHVFGSRARVVGSQARGAAVNAARLFRVNLANTLTLFNGVSGFLSIIASMHDQYFAAAFLILAGVVFDWLDGKAARRFGEETPLGRELDSLSDLVTFGVAPAVLVTSITPSWEAYVFGSLFVLAAALRLGRFNVQELKGAFFGVPTTANGLLLPALIFLGAPHSWFPWYLFIMALLMNAPIRIKKMF